jgi:hypothetical protein
MRYEARQAIFDPNVHVIVREGDFLAIPGHIRIFGPWKMLAQGEFSQLKKAYRLAIAHERFVVVRTPPSQFAPEPPTTSAIVISLDEYRRRGTSLERSEPVPTTVTATE